MGKHRLDQPITGPSCLVRFSPHQISLSPFSVVYSGPLGPGLLRFSPDQTSSRKSPCVLCAFQKQIYDWESSQD